MSVKNTAKVVMYTTATCPYCVNAKALLRAKAVEFQEIRIDEKPEQREEMMRLSGRRTVPQIFINDKPIGGFDDMKALDQRGELDTLLQT